MFSRGNEVQYASFIAHHLSVFWVMVVVSGCASDQLVTSDRELAMVLEPYCERVFSRTEKNYFEGDVLEMSSLASQLDAICQKRKISRAAVLASVNVEPFSNGKDCIAFALKKCGFYVDGVMFQFDGKAYVQRVRPFSAEL